MRKTLLALSLMLMNLGDVFQISILRIIPALLFFLIFFEEYVLNKRKVSFLSKDFLPLIIFFSLSVFSIFKTQRDDFSVQFIAFRLITYISFFFAYSAALFNVMVKFKPKTIFIMFMFAPLFLLISVNLCLFVFGFSDRNLDIGNSVMFSYLGVLIPRIKFFLATGVNGYGVVAGAMFVISLFGYFYLKTNKNFFILSMSVSLLSVLLTDSRGPLVYSLMSFGVVSLFMKKRKKPSFLWIIPFIGFFGPVLMITFLTMLSGTEFAESVARSSEDFSTGNSRLLIWTTAFSEFLRFNPVYHIFGYGEFGHYGAGLSQIYGLIFGDNESGIYMHPHNTILSIALDQGYFGLIVFIILQLQILKIVKEKWIDFPAMTRIILGFILYYNFVGIGETMIGFYYQNVMYIFLMIFIFTVTMNNKKIIEKSAYV